MEWLVKLCVGTRLKASCTMRLHPSPERGRGGVFGGGGPLNASSDSSCLRSSGEFCQKVGLSSKEERSPAVARCAVEAAGARAGGRASVRRASARPPANALCDACVCALGVAGAVVVVVGRGGGRVRVMVRQLRPGDFASQMDRALSHAPLWPLLSGGGCRRVPWALCPQGPFTRTSPGSIPHWPPRRAGPGGCPRSGRPLRPDRPVSGSPSGLVRESEARPPGHQKRL